MSSGAIAGSVGRSNPASRLLAELLSRQRTLCLYGLGMLALAVPLLGLMRFDPRLLHGVGVWDKPIRFCISTGVFSLTACWFFGMVRPDRRRSRPLRWTLRLLLGGGSFEVAWIGWQGAHGLDSHFNMSSSFYGLMFAVMGVAALLLVCSSLPLAWEIGPHPRPGLPPELAMATVAGLLLSVTLSAITGYTMAAHMGHAVGAIGGRLTLLGWNRAGGDLRAAHFLAVHAEQAVPVLVLPLRHLRQPRPRALTRLVILLYAGVTVAAFVQALAGHPLLP